MEGRGVGDGDGDGDVDMRSDGVLGNIGICERWDHDTGF